VADEAMFLVEGGALRPTEWAVGPWSSDALQGSAYGGLLVRALERSDAAAGMTLARLSFDLWRPVGLAPITTAVAVLRDGRKARTLEATLEQGGKQVARCTAVLLRIDAASAPPMAPVRALGPAPGPEAGRPVPPQVKAWSPFFTGVDTRVVEGDLLKPGPASAWFNLGRPLVAGEENSPFVHALSAADLAGGISAIVDLRVWTFVNADLTVTFWRTPRPPWILLSAATAAGDQGTGVTRGELSDVDGPFGACMQTLIFERRPASPRA
jgi:Thioesterase-like superfamily